MDLKKEINKWSRYFEYDNVGQDQHTFNYIICMILFHEKGIQDER